MGLLVPFWLSCKFGTDYKMSLLNSTPRTKSNVASLCSSSFSVQSVGYFNVRSHQQFVKATSRQSRPHPKIRITGFNHRISPGNWTRTWRWRQHNDKATFMMTCCLVNTCIGLAFLTLVIYFSRPIATNFTNRLQCEVAYNAGKTCC